MHALQNSKKNTARTRRGFSLTELLVVIGIIVLLVGLLLVALGQVQKKARRTRTEAIMNQFANACVAFQAEHGMYPGVIPDDVLRAHEMANGGESPISSTENAMLHLMGGYRVRGPSDTNQTQAWKEYENYVPFEEVVFLAGTPNEWRLKVNVQRIGEGPWINGKPYAPYFTPGSDDLVFIRNGFDENGAEVPGQVGEEQEELIPDLVDAWGQPILYLRQARNRGPLVEDTVTQDAARPQFMLGGINCFLQSEGLGEHGKNQQKMGIFGVGGTNPLTDEQKKKVFSAVLGHATFYKTDSPTAPLYGTARGAFALISAGPDGIYFSRFDGPRPAQPNNPIDTGNVQTLIIDNGPKVLDDPSTGFDDVRIYGGG